MELRRKKVVDPYDIWDEQNSGKSRKLHPSSKRSKKNPLPHPGQSYNPHPEDHKNLLQKVLKKEEAYQKKEASLKRADTRVDPKELNEDEREELVSGIKHLIKDKGAPIPQNEHDDSDGSSTDAAYSDYEDKDFQAIAKDKRVQEKRKSRSQRLRQMKDKLQRKAAKLRKIKNIRLSKFDSVKRMVKELDKKEKEEALFKTKRRHRKPKNERLGQKFEQSDPIYCLKSELPSNLRQVSCSMNAIVREQLESFQSRLLVEPTTFQVKKRKYKRKEFDRKVAAEQEG